jgi:hypothetical protein
MYRVLQITLVLTAVAFMVLQFSCASSLPASGTEANIKANSEKNPCPPAGTEVPFAKLMNPAFAADYAGCDVISKVEFLAAGQQEGYMWGAIPAKSIEGKVPFRVVAPGQAAEGSAAPFGSVPPHVFVEKAKSDIVFSLQKGDARILRGAPVTGSMGTTLNQKFTQVVFVATEVRKQ